MSGVGVGVPSTEKRLLAWMLEAKERGFSVVPNRLLRSRDAQAVRVVHRQAEATADGAQATRDSESRQESASEHAQAVSDTGQDSTRPLQIAACGIPLRFLEIAGDTWTLGDGVTCAACWHVVRGQF